LPTDYRKPQRKIIRTGPLSLYSQDGSFAAPDILINGNSMGELVWDIFKAHAKGGRIGPSTARWRLTLERIGSMENVPGGAA
jgi:hypothetical protein